MVFCRHNQNNERIYERTTGLKVLPRSECDDCAQHDDQPILRRGHGRLHDPVVGRQTHALHADGAVDQREAVEGKQRAQQRQYVQDRLELQNRTLLTGWKRWIDCVEDWSSTGRTEDWGRMDRDEGPQPVESICGGGPPGI